MATEVTEFAAAKVNLALHVTGRRADGYHLLDSLVVFADVGDRVTVRPSLRLKLRISGPSAGALPVEDDNLVLHAARLMGASVAIDLEKVLPVASGIGGGSADAAATLRAMARLTGRPVPDTDAVLSLGADVPVCLIGAASRLRGIGEVLHPLQNLPEGWLVLANPGRTVPTSQVFRALVDHAQAPMPKIVPRFMELADLVAFLRAQRNDLERAATGLEPQISDVSAALAAQAGCLLSRMSGSGATVFGLFATAQAARAAAKTLRVAQPTWWVAAAAMLSQVKSEIAADQRA